MAPVQIEVERAVMATFTSRKMLDMAIGCDGKSAPLGFYQVHPLWGWIL
jgi:hypothetical protein